MAGIYQMYKLQELEIDAVVLDSAYGPGGAWFDSESHTYGYSYSRELLDEWEWSEHSAGQPETLRCLNPVVDEFDLRRHMSFGCQVEGASFEEDRCFWTVRLKDGREFRGRFLLTAIGMLSADTMPQIEGVGSFEGGSWHTYHWHTYYWPHEPVGLAGKRVAVIGTGATGVQAVAEFVDLVGELTLF